MILRANFRTFYYSYICYFLLNTLFNEMTALYHYITNCISHQIHAIIACQLLTTITILIAMIWGKTST